MRIVSVLAVTTLAACSAQPSSSAAPAPATQTVRVSGSTSGANLSMAVHDESSVQKLAYSADAVWRVLPGALDSLGVPVRSLEPTTRKAGNPGFAVRRKLKSVALSRYLDCGSTQLGQNADDYDVNLSVLSEVRPANDGTATLITTVEAAARPANFSQDYNRCSSKGLLEARLVELVKARLAR